MNNPRDYLKNRVEQLNGMYRDRFPRWTNEDLVAVSLLLNESAQQSAQRTADTPPTPDDMLDEHKREIFSRR